MKENERKKLVNPINFNIMDCCI